MGQWIDTEQAAERAREVHHHAGLLTRAIRAGEQWWDELDRQNGFRDRWATITGREP